MYPLLLCSWLVFFLSFYLPMLGQEPLPFRQGDGFTFLNPDQSSAIAKVWEEASPFYNGYAEVKENERVGIIDPSGQYILRPLYEEIIRGDQWQVKRSGKWYLFQPESRTWSKEGYLSISPLQGGLFRVETPEGYTVLDSNAQELFPDRYEWLDHFYHESGEFTDLILLRSSDGRGLANWCGEIVLPPEYQRIGLVHDQWAVVMKGYKFGLIDLEGNFTIPCEYTNLYPPSEGLVPAKLGHLWGFLNPTGKIVLPFRYGAVNRSGFFKGQAGVSLHGEWVMIDRQGRENLLVSKPWINLGELSEGMVAAARFSEEKDLKYGFVDPEGNTKIDFSYDKAFAFEGGLAVVGLRNALGNSVVNPMRFGIIDRQGKMVVPIALERPHIAEILRDSLNQFGSISWYEGLRRFRIYKDGRTRKCRNDLINKLLLKYDGFRCNQAGLIAIRKGDKWGFCDATGKVIIPLLYDRVECFNHGLAKVWRNEGEDAYFYINESGQELLCQETIGK